MPTPVSTARQCLTEEAARVLDDAVASARRRCHAQTTSLHAVSVLLALPSSILRDACARSRSPAYSSRLHFSALDLCVKVSLDRLQSAKSGGGGEDDLPPVSNSLMAAVRRSQANQRRQPEMYQVTQITSAISSISSIKVELKNFVISILDDPLVSRVFGDAGFRSTEIKFAILHPPPPPPSARFFSSVTASGGRCPPFLLCNPSGSSFPISGSVPFPFPLAGSGVRDSDEDSNSQRIGEVLIRSSGRNPLLIGVCAKDALSRFKECVEKDKGESTFPTQIVGLHFISIEKDIMELLSIGGSTEVFNSKLEELRSTIEKHSGPGIIVSFGELEVFEEEDGRSEDSVKFVVQKLTALFKLHKNKMWLIGATGSETCTKFLCRFPSLKTEWDFHLLPINKSNHAVGEPSKSRLLGSFVPLGGFFSMPSDFRNPIAVIKKTFTRCSQCNDKCDTELSALKNGDSLADQHSSTLPSWLKTANSNTNKAPTPEITAEKTMELQRKWDDICQRLHQQPPNIPSPGSLGFQTFPIMQKPLTQEPVSLMPENGDLSAQSSCSLTVAPEHVSSSSVSSITTELQLGTCTPTNQVVPPSPSDPENEYKQILQKLEDKIPWQTEACHEIAKVVSRHRLNTRRDTWICLTGSDRMGKKKIASVLAELMCENRENLIAVDMSVQWESMFESNAVVDAQLPDDIQLRSNRKGTVDYIAQELRKKPCSLIYIENVDQSQDSLIQSSLSHAIQSGNILDSWGREVSLKNAVFLIAYNSTREEQFYSDSEITEDRIMKACSWQMQIVEDKCMNKRKQSQTSSSSKKPKDFLDLNVPVEGEHGNDIWFQDFLDRVENKIAFKPFDFDALANKLLRKMNLIIQRRSGSGFRLEVEEDVMLQILAATWCSDQEKVNTWIKEVVCETYFEAQRKLCYHKQMHLKIVSCPGKQMEHQQPGICLPRIINLS